ncbi:MAG: beta-ketoacyl-ACP synthase III [Burkholderiales bacterium]
MIYSRIAATGGYLPSRVVTNEELASRLDTSDEWISARTGIRSRHLAADDEMASDLALQAARKALQRAQIKAADLDLIIVATTTPDMIFPSTASILQAKLGASGCAAFDVQAVCSGFVYALSTADLYVRSGKCRNALVVGAELYSRILDWNDRATCVLFGDGAGAVVLTPSDTPGIIATRLHADGNFGKVLCVPGGVAHGKVRGRPFVEMDGGAVFKFAVKVLSEVAEEVMADASLGASDIHWLVPHQANVRIIEATARKLGMPMDRVVVTVAQHANTSAASIPLALDVALGDGRIRPGQNVLLEGVGGGFTWGAALVKWQ